MATSTSPGKIIYIAPGDSIALFKALEGPTEEEQSITVKFSVDTSVFEEAMKTTQAAIDAVKGRLGAEMANSNPLGLPEIEGSEIEKRPRQMRLTDSEVLIGLQFPDGTRMIGKADSATLTQSNGAVTGPFLAHSEPEGSWNINLQGTDPLEVMTGGLANVRIALTDLLAHRVEILGAMATATGEGEEEEPQGVEDLPWVKRMKARAG